MSEVDLGFSEECESWQVASYSFPSKIGGKPAWLNLENLPSPKKLQCATCREPLTFLCQVYSPYEDDDENFHRTLFVFICRKNACHERNSPRNIKVFRNSLRRDNKFYSFDPPDDEVEDFDPMRWVNLCNSCGCLADKKCNKCKLVSYCSKEHQIHDWKERHKKECGTTFFNFKQSSLLYHESELVIESEDYTEKPVDEETELENFKALELEGKTGTMTDIPSHEISQFSAIDKDKVFSKFKERIADNEEQVVRYERGGEPLWIAAEPKPTSVPNCELCGARRQFEFQIMPQLFSVLHDLELDVGIIVVYTCVKSCISGDAYKEEYVYRQDVALDT